jgi:2-polyprenyl-3-methyl-5-hydroxy-6-metoxy-1,4-benzoquinol methylase
MSDNNFDYKTMDDEERPFAARLAIYITQRLNSRVTDLGAGSGVYVEEIRKLGAEAQGYDINPNQPRPDLVKTATLFNVRDPAPVVLCLEVAEHIQEHLSPLVVKNIWENCEPGAFVIFSAAQPGQGGVGHINCRYPEFWANLAREAGFVLRKDLESELHDYITSGYHMGWFAKNRQVWQRPQQKIKLS